MKKYLIILLIFVSLGAIFFWYSNTKITPQTKYTGPVEKIRIATYKGERSALIYVADEKGFFAENGIEVEILENDSGVKSVDSIRNNEVDIGTAAEYPVVNDILDKKNDLGIFGVIDFVKAYEIIANKNAGINSLEDLKGKRIGLKKKSQAEFLFGVFLTTNNINDSEVEIIDIDPADEMNKLLNNEIDVTIVCDPFTNQIKTALNNNFLSWNAQPNRRFYLLSIAKKRYIEKNPELIKKFLNSLIQAEEFIKNNKEESQRIVQKRIGTSLVYLQNVWDKNIFNLTLNQSLILTMEDEARWKISKDQLNVQIPNYLNFIYFKGLDEIDASRINIIR